MKVRFEWNPQKATTNIEKHGVSFQEAQTVFADPYAVIIPDEWHSVAEEREIIIGTSSRLRLLFVVFIERLPQLIRIISARRATRKEQEDYEHQRFS